MVSKGFFFERTRTGASCPADMAVTNSTTSTLSNSGPTKLKWNNANKKKAAVRQAVHHLRNTICNEVQQVETVLITPQDEKRPASPPPAKPSLPMKKTQARMVDFAPSKSKRIIFHDEASVLETVKHLWDYKARSVKAALKKLAQACDYDEECNARANLHRQFIGKHGGPLAILKAMERFPKDASLQTHACVALAYLVLCEGVEVIVAELGGIETILEAMRAFSKDPQVQSAGCGALQNLCYASGQNARSVLESKHGLQRVLLAMKSHPQDAGLQQHACGAIHNLASWANDKERVQILRANVLTILIKVMEFHADDQDVQKMSCLTLKSILGPEKFDDDLLYENEPRDEQEHVETDPIISSGEQTSA